MMHSIIYNKEFQIKHPGFVFDFAFLWCWWTKLTTRDFGTQTEKDTFLNLSYISRDTEPYIKNTH